MLKLRRIICGLAVLLICSVLLVGCGAGNQAYYNPYDLLVAWNKFDHTDLMKEISRSLGSVNLADLADQTSQSE